MHGEDDAPHDPAADPGPPPHADGAPERGATPADEAPPGADASAADVAPGTDATVPDAPTGPGAAERARRAARRIRELNEDGRVLDAVARLRRRLPGDDRLGDPLSTSDQGGDPTLGRRIARLAGQTTGGAVHEVGMGALQVWQAAAERNGRGRGTVDMTILFTDLVGFSHWALEAGDQATLLLLREVSGVLEPAVQRRRGQVVKWLGDGMMAVFREPEDALHAVERMWAGLEGLEIAGYQPRIRAGMHVGRPRRVGADYLGVDVNIAARVAQAAGTSELLASDAAVAGIAPDAVVARRRKRFRAKGVPPELEVFALRSA
ncbi:adenylate/guanylate cyclase domain-containing protein [Patulibacter sp.]|uniref:adenylate/guanylate cyclase domain-containing protein n=1 Tax=Patulibacter sp. TaxID=1912859 RepID=UPI002723F7D8|nr:adenylate/guanylate cyclase domain-containing protein [Patulibacter sp.]MDO9409778.1 adenylate/guanylate cyclase domain-containing protein [Patulibacter sp.]